MTISQALRAIAKLKGQIKETQAKAHACVVYSKANPPAYKFKTCKEQLIEMQTQLRDLEVRLRRTNAVTNIHLGTGQFTLTYATVRLQELKGWIAWLRSLPTQAHAEVTTESPRNIGGQYVLVPSTQLCDLPEADRDTEIRALQSAFDEINDAVEATNHRTELV